MSAEIVLPAILLMASLICLGRATSGFGRSGRLPDAGPGLAAFEGEGTERAAGSPFRSMRGGAAATDGGLHFGVCQLEGFENIRRHVGYKAANALVNEVSEIIGRTLPSCSIGRTNRTTIEFAWAGSDVGDAQVAVDALQAALPRTFALEDCALDVRPRIGFQRGRHDMTGEAAFEFIDAALGDAATHNLDVIFVPEDDASALDDRLHLLKELSAAITNDRLDVHYQPKLDCRTERVTSVEALLRWTHGSLGVIAPDLVVKAAEETGLIRRLTVWVLQRVLRDLDELGNCGVALPIYVNISGALLSDERFAATAVRMIRGKEVLIGFEITETAVIRDPDRALANLTLLRAAGISIAIDDYGSGLSSLAYLKRLPAQELKIDQLFISRLTSEHRDPLLVRSSIDLAHALEMKVTAEGVDDPMTLALLTIMGCDMVQGYLISRPLPLAGLVEFLRRDSHVGHIQASPALLFGKA